MYSSPSSLLRKNSEVPAHLLRRTRNFSILSALILLSIFFRLWNLQVIHGERFRVLSENNRIAYRVVRSPRGVIYDSDGQVLADNRPSFNVFLIKEDVKRLNHSIRILSRTTNQSPETLKKKVRRASPFRPFLIKSDVNRRTVAFLEEHRPELPGVFIQVTPLRRYPKGDHAGHLLGTLGEVGPRDLNSLEKPFRGKRLRKKTGLIYRQGDLIGKRGLEFSHETLLKGESGFKQVEVDAYGRELRVVHPFNEKPGLNIQLTLNYDLQEKAETLFEKFEGSIVAIDPNDGAILAMVSKPSLDPNKFAGGIQLKDWRTLRKNHLKPLQNRGIRSQYMPGSIFKIVMAFATLSKGVQLPGDKIFCNGKFPFGGRVFNDWKKGGHGHMNLVQALAQSCDVYFYNVGNSLGIKRIAMVARMFGLGSPTGFTSREKGGLVPSDAWKQKRFKERWYKGETISVSIGQGFNLITPLQAANLIATTANGGTLWKPYIVRHAFDRGGRVVFEHKPTAIRQIPIKPEIFEKVQKGLWEVVNGPRGTAKKAAIPGVGVAGKTGTVQTASLSLTGRKKNPESLPRKFRDHGWFIAYAPFKNPKIAVAILGEHAGRPGSSFAPIARKLISFYLKGRISQEFLASNISPSPQTALQTKPPGEMSP